MLFCLRLIFSLLYFLSNSLFLMFSIYFLHPSFLVYPFPRLPIIAAAEIVLFYPNFHVYSLCFNSAVTKATVLSVRSLFFTAILFNIFPFFFYILPLSGRMVFIFLCFWPVSPLTLVKGNTALFYLSATFGSFSVYYFPLSRLPVCFLLLFFLCVSSLLFFSVRVF